MSSPDRVLHSLYPPAAGLRAGPGLQLSRVVVPRVVADLVMVHMALLAAIAVEGLARQVRPEHVLYGGFEAFRNYYLTVFCPLSLLIPCVHAIGGLYTRALSWSMPVKLVRAAASAAAGAMLVVGISFLLGLPSESLAAVLAGFSFLVVAGTPGARLLKHVIAESDAKRQRARAGGEGRTVLVVGGAGYIGSILLRKLLARGYTVRVLDSLVYGDRALRELLQHPRFTLIRGDCRNIHDVVAAMSGVHCVVHLAAIVGDPACDWDRKTAREVNYAATRMMIEVAKGEGPVRFVFASSCSVYGITDDLMDEDSPVNPISIYAETKLDSEAELLHAADDDFHPTILRFSTIFGLSPRPRFDLVVNLLTARACREGLITIYNGQQWRPFLHVSDAAESVIRVLEAPLSVVRARIFNVGDDRLNYNLAAVGRRIREVFPATRVEEVENADHRDYRVSFQRIRKRLGFTCSKTLEDGIEELKAALDEGTIADYRDPIYSNIKFLQEHGSPATESGVTARVMAALAEKA